MPSSEILPALSGRSEVITGTVKKANDDDIHKVPDARGPPRRGGIQRTGSRVFLPRLVNRNLPYHQSKNRMNVQNNNHGYLWSLILHDWFHVLLRTPSYITVPSLLALWTGTVVLWASIYVYVDTNNFHKDCGLGQPGFPIGFGTGFAFSLITASTVGYGLPGSAGGFFSSNCGGLQTAIYFQMLMSMMFNAFLIAFFYSQLSKAENRSIQLIFGNKLCINVTNGRVYAYIRCYDLDSVYPVVECHARMYLLDHQLKMHQLRLTDPNDELHGMMYPSLPQTISHQIDHHSALSPRSMPLVVDDCGLMLRSADSTISNREEIFCPICGECFGTYERLFKHVLFNQTIEKLEKYPPENLHLAFEMPDISPITLEEVQHHIENTLSEIIVVIEGIDPQLSGSFQAVQSYKYDDIEFGADFAPCLFVRDNKMTVDMRLFHDVIAEHQESSDSDSAVEKA